MESFVNHYFPTWKQPLTFSAIIIADMAKTTRTPRTGSATKPTGPHVFIKEHIDHLGLSDEVVAGRLGITTSALWKRYSEQWRLTPFKIKQIAEALDMHPSELNFPPGTPSLDAIASTVSEKRRREMADIVARLARENEQED